MACSRGKHLKTQPMRLCRHLEHQPSDATVYVTSDSPFPESGQYGDLYEGRLTQDGVSHTVALKSLRDTCKGGDLKKKERLDREVQIWSSLHHPNLLPLFGTCSQKLVDDEKSFMVSPFMKNGNAASYLRRNPSADRVKLLSEVASALLYLHTHSRTIIHGDIKAENILISDEGSALLADFGLSMVFDEHGVPLSYHRGGTMRFMAPEVLLAETVVLKSKPTDVYAFGMLIYQIYAGKPPLDELKDIAFLKAISLERRPDRPSNCPDEVWKLAVQCCQDDACLRPSMTKVAAELDAIISSLRLQSTRTPPASPVESALPDDDIPVFGVCAEAINSTQYEATPQAIAQYGMPNEDIIWSIRTAVARDPSNPELLLTLARLYWKFHGNGDAAISAYHDAIRCGAHAEDCYDEMTDVHLYRGEPDWFAVKRLYLSAAQLYPQEPWPYVRLAWTCAQVDEVTSALSACDVAVSRGASAKDCFNLVESCFRRREQPNWVAILELYESAAVTYGHEEWPWLELADARARARDASGAISACLEAIRRGANPVECFEHVAEDCRLQNPPDWATMKAVYDGAAAMYESYAWPRIGLARALAGINRLGGALAAIRDAVLRGASAPESFQVVADVFRWRDSPRGEPPPSQWERVYALYQGAIVVFGPTTWARWKMEDAVHNFKRRGKRRHDPYRPDNEQRASQIWYT